MNFWGYSTVNFFSPMARYSSNGYQNCGLNAVNEFKHLVREAHKRGIEVKNINLFCTTCGFFLAKSVPSFFFPLLYSIWTGDHGCCFQPHC